MLKSSYRIFSAWGVPVRIHISLLLILILFVILSAGGDPVATILTFVLLFGSVVLHELAHSLVARAHGIPVRDITLYPIGGIARLEEMPRRPSVELMVAAAGPLASLALAGAAAGVMLLQPAGTARDVTVSLLVVNAFLGLFNLLPGFPMDGGRILRSILAMRMPYLRATAIATRIGTIVAYGFIVLGIILPRIDLLLVGIFVLFMAKAEYHAVRLREAFSPWVYTDARGSVRVPEGGAVWVPPRGPVVYRLFFEQDPRFYRW